MNNLIKDLNSKDFKNESALSAIYMAEVLLEGGCIHAYHSFYDEVCITGGDYASNFNSKLFKSDMEISFSVQKESGWKHLALGHEPDFYDMVSVEVLNNTSKKNNGCIFYSLNKSGTINSTTLKETLASNEESNRNNPRTWSFWPHLESLIEGCFTIINGEIKLSNFILVKARLEILRTGKTLPKGKSYCWYRASGLSSDAADIMAA